MADLQQRTYELLMNATDGGLDQLEPQAVTVDEELSQPYRIVLEAVTIDPADPGSLDLGSWLRKKVGVGLARGGEPTWFHGVVVSAEHTGADHRQRQLVRLELAPALELLRHTRRTRVFAEQKPFDVVRSVLQQGSVSPLDFKAAGAAGVQRHITQFEESDLAFASRLLEQEGAAYWFRHDKSAHTLVVGDAVSHHPGKDDAIHAVFAAAEGFDAQGEGVVASLARRFEVAPRGAEVRDYSEGHPKQPATGQHQSAAERAPGAIGVHAEADYHVTMSDADAKAYAERLADRLTAGACRLVGSGSVLAFRAGARVAVHGRDGYGDHLLLVSVRHRFADDSYRNDFTAVPVAALPWRPPRRTPIPRIDGVVPGVVTAAAGAQGKGEDGSYKVKILAVDGDHERVVRMAQPSAGPVQGMHFPLPPNTEVLLAHEYGHPDRPVIAGAMVNAEDASPVKDANKTQSVLRSASGSELVFEDADGKHSITLRTPKGNELRFDDENELMSMTAPKDHKIAVTGKSDTAVTGKTTLDCSDEITISAANKITIKVGGSSIVIEPAKVTITTTELVLSASGALKASGASITQEAQGAFTAKAASAEIAAQGSAKLSAAQVEIAGTASTKLSAAQIEIAASATAKVSAGAMMEVSGAMTKVSGSGICEIKGGVVKNN